MKIILDVKDLPQGKIKTVRWFVKESDPEGNRNAAVATLKDEPLRYYYQHVDGTGALFVLESEREK